MRAELADRRRDGPFLISARGLLLITGIVSLSLAVVNLPFERRSTNVDTLYVSVAGVVALIWLVSLVLAWRGSRLGAFLSGLIAFVEFGVIAAAHFETAPWDIDVYANHEGLWLAGVLIALLPSCALTMMAAIVCWSHPTGRLRRL
ncbi:MAG TPA: hypothetical protein VM674_01470, partial [Candidatus Acidoferrum sp.]|nr:hypothetical protein [Candidatus Acidoferrum sp.]